MIRTILSSLLLLFCGIQLILAQDSIATKPAWPLDIISFQVSFSAGLAAQTSGNLSSASGAGNLHSAEAQSGKSSNQRLDFIIKPKNSTPDKTITSIEWETCFTNLDRQVIKSKFRSKKKIKPGKEESIQEGIFYNATLVPTQTKVGFRIIKIEYEDKSTWQTTAKDEGMDIVYKEITLQ